jgi:NADH-quinone oxidoreductase subunit H
VNEEMTVGEAEAQGLMRVYVNDVSYSIHQAKIIKPDKVVVKGRIEQADVNKYEKVVATWSLPMQAADLGAGFLYIFAISSLAVYAVVLAGWSSNSKYSLLGGLRSSAQMISYEVSIGLAIIGIVMIFGSVRLNDIVQGQGWHFIGYGPDGSFQWVSDTGLIPMWGIIIQPLGFVLYTICAFAETNRNPFDLPEGESEIVAGYHVEYSSMKFALFFMAEYVNILVQAAIITTLFLGGWQVPWLPTPVLAENIGTVMPIIFALNCGLCIGFGILMKRYHMTNQHAWADLRKHEGSVLTKVSFLKGLFFLVLLALCFSSFAPWKWSAWGAPVFTAIVQFGVFLTKLILVAWVFIWVRWTLPRFRYDQLMKLGWQVMLPLALVNLLITGFLLLVIYMTGLS